MPVSQIDTPPAAKFTVSFAEGDSSRADLLGGKGAGLAGMTQAGLPVPPGFIIATDACRARGTDRALPPGLMEEVRLRFTELEKSTGRLFGGGPAPLLVSVRSGAQISMPGMMDTILNLGLNLDSAVALALQTGDLAFAADTYQRFGRQYGETVLAADAELVGSASQAAVQAARNGEDPHAALAAVEAAIQEALLDDVGDSIPDDPYLQLTRAIEAVFDSWNSRRAIVYRNHQKIPHELGTAVVVQAMVFGNFGSPSGTGVAFTRNPLTGERELYGEFLEGGQGEDLVAGIRTPEKLSSAVERLPEVFKTFHELASRLEEVYGDVLDIEFTVECGELYLLQVRSAKRTAQAAIRVAADFLQEGKATPLEALGKISPSQVSLAERPRFDEGLLAKALRGGALLGSGIGASPGHTSGKAMLDPERVLAAAGHDGTGEDVILIRPTTSPQDLHGMVPARGIITALGGATSHAAVVARALNKPCIVGCGTMEVDLEARRFCIGGRCFDEGAQVSIDGSSGEIFEGALPLTTMTTSGGRLERLLTIADDAAGCRISARATTPDQVAKILDHGASGVICRLGDILAVHGRFAGLLDVLLSQAEADRVDMRGFDEMVADFVEPLLVAAGDTPIVFRAVDLVGDEAMELLDAPKLVAQSPRLAVSLGVPDLISAQVAGLSLAARRAGYRRLPQLVVRHVNDVNEAREIRRIADEHVGPHGKATVHVGATLTSPRGVQFASEILREVDVVWVEVRGLQAAQFGYPSRMLLTAEPLDSYIRRGMISADPRTSLDGAMAWLISSVTKARMSPRGGHIGIRIAGPVSEEVTAAFFRAGFRSFAVDADEVRPARLAFGKAALAEQRDLDGLSSEPGAAG